MSILSIYKVGELGAGGAIARLSRAQAVTSWQNNDGHT